VPSTGPIIAADQVSKSFGPNEVLRRVSLPVAEKDMVCVIGPSGSGKTTLLRCLALLEQPSTGRVTMRGTTIASPKPDSAERRAARAVRLRNRDGVPAL
jgi:ABC-type Fe3+/spermidine/putrescine transport system ATPase subunit